MRDAKLVIVHAFASGPEADMARSALEAAGIDAMIQADSVVKFEQQWATQQGTAHIDRARRSPRHD